MPAFPLVAHRRPDHFISKELVDRGIWEPYETQVLLSHLREGSVFLDLGANIGYYTVLASKRCGPGGRVHAFEPEPVNFSLLERNVALNGCENVNLVHAAASDADGHTELYLSDFNQGDHRLYANEAGREHVRVRTVSMDSHFAGSSTIVDLVKMDTQGCEARIVAGMVGLMEANRGRLAMIVEYWPFGLEGAGDDAEGLVRRLAPFGFRVREIDEADRSLRETSWPELLARAATDLHPATQGFVNLLLTPDAAGR
ncbi:MAG: FkbM family methyltransferase [Betaproteobacteria bacterium]|nr:FkbM family methyltransferase [Betaproteobacteria bacterium]